MAIRATLLVLTIAIVVSACSERQSVDWPPQYDRMAEIFDLKKSTFIEIEREMVEDGLLRMSPGIFSEMQRNPTMPGLPSQQAQKYLELLAEADMFVSVVRRAQYTEFEMMIENEGPRLYLSRFIHSERENTLPTCSSAMDRSPCGACAVELERDWLMEFSWFPADPDEEARLCADTDTQRT